MGKIMEGANIIFVVLMHFDMFVDLIVKGLTEAMGVAKKKLCSGQGLYIAED